MQEQRTKDITLAKKPVINEKANQANQSVLTQLYRRFADEDGRLSYKIMCNVLQTLLKGTSSCYSLLINIVDPRTDMLDITETAKIHSQILKVWSCALKSFLLTYNCSRPLVFRV